MAATVRPAQDHTVTLTALEVLRLITDRVEKDEVADTEDVEFVLQFFGEVSRQCPDGTISELLEQLAHCHRTGECGKFVDVSRRYTDSVMRVLASNQRITTESSVRPTLRRLEVKYVSPHCI